MDTIQELEYEVMETRKTLMRMIYHAKTGHTGGSLSDADIMTALYFSILDVDPKDPEKRDRDRFVLSKGHCVEAYLAVLAKRGFFPQKELETFSRYQSRLIGHPSNKIPGIEMNTGALGHGLAIGVGMALGLRRLKSRNRVFVLMGDGEQAEGSVWEALMAGAHYRLDNLVAIVDRNHLQISGDTEDVMALEPLDRKYRDFGWEVIEIDGNDMAQILPALSHRPAGKPLMVMAHTTKGKGVREMENDPKWHHGVPDKTLFESAMAQFEQRQKEIRNA